MLAWIIRSMAALMAGMRQYGQKPSQRTIRGRLGHCALPLGAILRRRKPLLPGAETSLDAPFAGPKHNDAAFLAYAPRGGTGGFQCVSFSESSWARH